MKKKKIHQILLKNIKKKYFIISIIIKTIFYFKGYIS